MRESFRMLLGSASMLLVAAGPGNSERSKNKAGGVMTITGETRDATGALTGGVLTVGHETGRVSFDRTMSGLAQTQHCTLRLTTYGDEDQGWTLKATQRPGSRACPGVMNGVYLNF